MRAIKCFEFENRSIEFMKAMTISAAKPYYARLDRTELLKLPDGKSVFKVYYASLLGRENPAQYEWSKDDLDSGSFANKLTHAGLQGVGFITAFPHITKAFRFAPSSEILLHVRAFNSRTMLELSLARDDAHVEFACLAEALIAADEYRCWAAARSVEEYLKYFSTQGDMQIVDFSKLAAYWG